MLINTLFLSKPLVNSEHSGKSENSEKMFGFLFSEIMNVNNDSEKLGLIPEHIGGNLIDYKSVFINYSFDSNVILSNTNFKETNDPIVSLSKLFFEEDNSNNQKISETEKIIYSPQQFVNSFSNLIKLLVEKNNLSENVELKLFSKNFILSQNVDSSHIPNIEKFLFETIENESAFSLTLSAAGKKVLFEILSQVIPSIITQDKPDIKENNKTQIQTLNNELKSEHQFIPDNNSDSKNYLSKTSSEIIEHLPQAEKTERKLFPSENKNLANDEDQTILQNIQSKNQDSSERKFNNDSVIPQPKSDNIFETTVKDDQLKLEFNSYTEKVKSGEANYKHSNETHSVKNSSIEQTIKAHSTEIKTEQKSITELISNTQKQENDLLNPVSKIEKSSSKNSDNPQIKIIIQTDRSNTVSTKSSVNPEIITDITKALESNQTTNKNDITVKVITNQQSQQNEIIDAGTGLNQNDTFISDRQLQNLFRAISYNKASVQSELSTVSKLNLEKINGQKTVLNQKEESNQSIQQNNVSTEVNPIRNNNKTVIVDRDLRSIELTNDDNPILKNQTEIKNIQSSDKSINFENIKLNQRNDFVVNPKNESDVKAIKIPANELNIKSDIKASEVVSTNRSIQNNFENVTNKVTGNYLNDTFDSQNSNSKIENIKPNISTSNEDQSVSNNFKPSYTDTETKNVKISFNDNELLTENFEIKNPQSTNKSLILDSDKDKPSEPLNVKPDKSLFRNPDDFSTYKSVTKLKINDSSINDSSIKDSESSTGSLKQNFSKDINRNFEFTSKSKTDLNRLAEIKNQNTELTSSIKSFEKQKSSLTDLNINDLQNQTENKSENNKTLTNQDIKSLKVDIASKSVSSDNQTQKNKSISMEDSKPNSDFHKTEQKIQTINTKSVDGLNKNEGINLRTESNIIKIQKEYSSNDNHIRIVSEKPPKGVVGFNQESSENKQSFSQTLKINSDNQKETKISAEKINVPNKELLNNEAKNEFNNQQEDGSKNSYQESKSTLIKENHNVDEEINIDFRNTVSGLDKKISSVSMKSNNELNIDTKKFEFNKFIESKSLENFVKTLNENNLNYRAELNNLFKNNNSVELRLYPEELGRVKITIDNSENIVSAKIEVQSEQAKNIILSNLTHLRESLRQEGLNPQNLNVYLGSEEHKGQNSANQKRKNGNNKNILQNEDKTDQVKQRNLGYNTIEYLA